MSRWQWILIQFARKLWVRATLIGLMGVVAAVLAAVAERFIPWNIPGTIGAEAVDRILYIIASSMLAVTTFSLSVMTSAYGAATNNVTPRATKLLLEDHVTQNVLSTFLGSFLFGIVGIVALKIGAYGDRGRVILFVVTIGVILLIVVSLLRWIDHLTRLGRLGETTDRVEQVTRKALEERWREPYLGGVALRDPSREIPSGAVPVRAQTIGYVQHVDMAALSRVCENMDADIFMAACPGAFIYQDTPLVWMSPHETKDAKDSGEDGETERHDAVRHAFSIGTERSFDQDPRFGLAVMSEIGLRAISSAVNDPGTAIDIIGRNTRLLNVWAGDRAERGDLSDGEPHHPRVHVPGLEAKDLFEDAFMLLARDGAASIEIQLRIQKALSALGRIGDSDFRAAAALQSRMAFERADLALSSGFDKARLREILGKAF